MVRRERLLQVAAKYIEENCDDKGVVKESNYTEQERKGIKKIKQRIKDKEIVVRPTDKSHKLCVCTWTNYLEQGKSHTEKDRKVTWGEVESMVRVCNSTARALTKIFRVGESKGSRNRERVMDAYTSNMVSIPPLAMLPKDHKKVEGPVPASRPVCLCTSSIVY